VIGDRQYRTDIEHDRVDAEVIIGGSGGGECPGERCGRIRLGAQRVLLGRCRTPPERCVTT